MLPARAQFTSTNQQQHVSATVAKPSFLYKRKLLIVYWKIVFDYDTPSKK
jgi:hypothetical protein